MPVFVFLFVLRILKLGIIQKVGMLFGAISKGHYKAIAASQL